MKYDRQYYQSVHNWLNRNYKKNKKCEHCITTDGKFEWALIKGKDYEKNRDNYIELCIRCHRLYDGLIDNLTKLKYKPVIALNDAEKLSFDSIKEATEELDILASSISNALKGRAKTAGGYRWQYV